MVMGTALYVSPEQATGEPLTGSSDMYSLGVVAYECLAGHPPFTASQPLAIAIMHKHDPVPPLPPDVPRPVADLVYADAGQDPGERPASVRAVADRADVLRDALALGDVGPVRRYPGVTRADLPPRRPELPCRRGRSTAPARARLRPAARAGPDRRRRWWRIGSTAVLCAVAAAAGLYLQQSSPRARPAETPAITRCST